MADEKRVFDVAKPGSSKPDTGSKPMVVGHKMMKDPTLKDSEDDNTEELQKIQQTASKTIKPLSKDESTDLEVQETTQNSENEAPVAHDEEPQKQEPQATEKAETEDIKKEDQSTDKPDTSADEAVNIAEKKETSAQEDALEQEENLQKIIKEKTYNVHIEEASAHAFKTFLKTFFIVAILGLIIMVVLIDAEIIDLGVTLPFDFL